MSDIYQPKPEHKFTFGLWTVGNLTGHTPEVVSIHSAFQDE